MRRPSASLVVATTALVVASTGTGFAASRYVISSSHQVKPGALSAANLSAQARKSLRGKPGPRGPAGTAGAAGAVGAPGAKGADGATGDRGPSDAWLITQTGRGSGVTLTAGSYAATGTVYFGDAQNPQCTVWHSTGIGGSASGITSFGPATNGQYTLPAADAFTVTDSTTVWVDCSGGSNSVVNPRLIVTQVGTLH